MEMITVHATATPMQSLAAATSTIEMGSIPDHGIDIRKSLNEMGEKGLDLTQPIPLRNLPKTKLNVAKLLLLEGDSHKLERDMAVESATQGHLLNLMAETYNRKHFVEKKEELLCERKLKYLNCVIRKVRHHLEENGKITL